MAENIAEVLAMLLPAGLLFDSPEIYAEVAKLPIVPLEDVRRHWQCTESEHLPPDIVANRLPQLTPRCARSYEIPLPVVWKTSGGTSGVVTGAI